MLVFDSSGLRFASGVFCLYVFTTVPFDIVTEKVAGSVRSIVIVTLPPSLSTPASVSVAKVRVLSTQLRSI